MQGLPALQPLGPARMAQSLGRGSAGWAGRAGRRDNCSLGGEQCGAACTRANYTQRDMMARWVRRTITDGYISNIDMR